jgi:hypothetical protein
MLWQKLEANGPRGISSAARLQSNLSCVYDIHRGGLSVEENP